VAARRGLPIEDVAPAGMLKARRESDAIASAAAREAQTSGAQP
jgi:small subunit ribosomal protein S5